MIQRRIIANAYKVVCKMTKLTKVKETKEKTQIYKENAIP